MVFKWYKLVRTYQFSSNINVNLMANHENSSVCSKFLSNVGNPSTATESTQFDEFEESVNLVDHAAGIRFNNSILFVWWKNCERLWIFILHVRHSSFQYRLLLGQYLEDRNDSSTNRENRGIHRETWVNIIIS